VSVEHTGTATTERDPRGVIARAAAVLALLGLLTLLAACGSNKSTGTSADPATVIPAPTPVYLGAEVRPRNPLKENALEAGRKLTGRSEPFVGLLGALQTPGSPPLNYSRDVEPWLGHHGGAFLSSLHGTEALGQVLLAGGAHLSFPFGPGGAKGAVVLDTSDLEAAKSFVNRAAARAGAKPESFHGVTVLGTSGGDAFAIVKRFVVLGTLAAVQSVIETSQGAASLATTPDYEKLRHHAPAQALAHLYLASTAAGPAAGTAGEVLGAVVGTGATMASLTPEHGAVTADLDVLAPAGAEGLLSSASEGAQALGALPGESWLALGIGNAHAALGADLGRIGSLLGSLGGESSAAGSGTGLLTGGLEPLVRALLSPLEALGANTPKAQADYASWMGPAGVFASGAGILELRAGVVIQSSDAALSKAAVGKLAAQMQSQGATVQPASVPGAEAAVSVGLHGLPLPVVIASGQDPAGQPSFVLGLGANSVTSALNPNSTLAGSERSTAAAHALGEGIQPSLIVEVPTLLALAEGLGLTGSADSGLMSYARAATMVSGGTRELGQGIQRVKLVVGLSGSGG
jgi:hypothetical protein